MPDDPSIRGDSPTDRASSSVPSDAEGHPGAGFEPGDAYPFGPPPPTVESEHRFREAAAPIPSPPVRTNILLFLLTLASCIYWGFMQYQQFYVDELRGQFVLNPFNAPSALLGGLPFGVAVIAVLLAHEMGHYLACRYYGIAATLPYFLPLPPPPFFPTLLPGTMGAVIRIRSPITSRRALFDIAVAGPIAGWVAAMPILAYGLSQSTVVSAVEIETSGGYLTLGEPLIWGAMSSLFGPDVSASQDLVMHPMAFVGWFALLITAMNLLPVGQLDGGHLLYSLRPRMHRLASFTVLALMLFAGFAYFLGWILFAVVVSLLFLMGGFRHPRPRKFEEALGGPRIAVAVLTVVIFVTSFMLVPVTLPQVFR